MRTLFTATALFAMAGTAQAGGPVLMGIDFGTGDVDAGVLCTVGEVTVLAATDADCTTIGGKATHSVTHTVAPITEE